MLNFQFTKWEIIEIIVIRCLKIIQKRYLMNKVSKISATSALNYSDMDEVKDWAKMGVDFVSSRLIMKGIDGKNFSPAGKYSRQQAFISMLRLLHST